MGELRLFFAAIWQDWIALMSGLAGVILAAAGASGFGQLPDWAFWLTAGICFLVAAFRVWREQFRTAHPYDEASFQHARKLFDGLPDGDKSMYVRLLVEKRVYLQGEDNRMLRRSGLIRHDPVTGDFYVSPDYESAGAALAKEWEHKQVRPAQ